MCLLLPGSRSLKCCVSAETRGDHHRKSPAFWRVLTSFTKRRNCSSLSFSHTITTFPNSPTRYPSSPCATMRRSGDPLTIQLRVSYSSALSLTTLSLETLGDISWMEPHEPRSDQAKLPRQTYTFLAFSITP